MCGVFTCQTPPCCVLGTLVHPNPCHGWEDGRFDHLGWGASRIQHFKVTARLTTSLDLFGYHIRVLETDMITGMTTSSPQNRQCSRVVHRLRERGHLRRLLLGQHPMFTVHRYSGHSVHTVSPLRKRTDFAEVQLRQLSQRWMAVWRRRKLQSERQGGSKRSCR